MQPPYEIQHDPDTGTYAVLAVPFFEAVNRDDYRAGLRFGSGEIHWPTDVGKIAVNVDHNSGKVIGRVTALMEDDRGVWAQFKLDRVGQAMYAAGVQRVSAELVYVDAAGAVTRDRDRAAVILLTGLAVVDNPALPSAQMATPPPRSEPPADPIEYGVIYDGRNTMKEPVKPVRVAADIATARRDMAEFATPTRDDELRAQRAFEQRRAQRRKEYELAEKNRAFENCGLPKPDESALARTRERIERETARMREQAECRKRTSRQSPAIRTPIRPSVSSESRSAPPRSSTNAPEKLPVPPPGRPGMRIIRPRRRPTREPLPFFDY